MAKDIEMQQSTKVPSRLAKFADGLRIIFKILGIFLPHLFRILSLKFTEARHNRTYKPVASPKNIVIIGGSFAGVKVAKWLADAVPTGFRVVIIEKNSHFNYWFAFPRYSVVAGYEKDAFIPYDAVFGSCIKKGSLLHIQAEASSITDSQVLLKNGEAIDYTYLVVATGSSQPPPAKMISVEADGAQDELRENQRNIAVAQRIAVIGSGAVGIEVATDIKGYFSEKNVTLFSSRDVIMPNFAPKLRDHVRDGMEKLGVDIRYHSRPRALPDGKTVQFPDGRTEVYDLVLPCTGQTPNSGILASYLPEAISKQTGRILVKPNFQLKAPQGSNIFALGDVAEHGGPRMARAVFVQAGIMRDNMLQVLKGRPASKEYKPKVWMEGAIQLTIGKNESLAYSPGDDGKDMLFPGAGYPDDFKVAHGWWMIGAKYPGHEELKQGNIKIGKSEV